MSKREDYEKRCEALLTPIAEANHVEIYDIEYVREGGEQYLRCYIDKEEGVSSAAPFPMPLTERIL